MQSSGRGISGRKGEQHALESVMDNLAKPEAKEKVQHSLMDRKKRKQLLQEKQKHLCEEKYAFRR